MKIQSAKDLENIGQNYRQQLYYPEGIKVNIGMASCGIAAGAQDAFDAAAKTAEWDLEPYTRRHFPA